MLHMPDGIRVALQFRHIPSHIGIRHLEFGVGLGLDLRCDLEPTMFIVLKDEVQVMKAPRRRVVELLVVGEGFPVVAVKGLSLEVFHAVAEVVLTVEEGMEDHL